MFHDRKLVLERAFRELNKRKVPQVIPRKLQHPPGSGDIYRFDCLATKYPFSWVLFVPEPSKCMLIPRDERDLTLYSPMAVKQCENGFGKALLYPEFFVGASLGAITALGVRESSVSGECMTLVAEVVGVLFGTGSIPFTYERGVVTQWQEYRILREQLGQANAALSEKLACCQR